MYVYDEKIHKIFEVYDIHRDINYNIEFLIYDDYAKLWLYKNSKYFIPISKNDYNSYGLK